MFMYKQSVSTNAFRILSPGLISRYSILNFSILHLMALYLYRAIVGFTALSDREMDMNIRQELN